MNKKVLLGLIFGSSALFVVLSSYLWYQFFISNQNKTIVLNKSGDNIIVSSNNTIDNPIKYYMEVKNYNVNKNYSLYIVDNNKNNNFILNRNNINYQLILNGNIIKENKLLNINNVIDNRYIANNISNNYELLLWVDEIKGSALSYQCEIKLMEIA